MHLIPASGDRDHTTLPSASGPRSSREAKSVHRLPRPTFVTTRTPLLRVRDGERIRPILFLEKRIIFVMHLETPERIEPTYKISFSAQLI